MPSRKISQIRKRNGRTVDFEKEKITRAIWGAAQAVGGRDRKLAERLCNRVVALLEERFPQGIPGVEDCFVDTAYLPVMTYKCTMAE